MRRSAVFSPARRDAGLVRLRYTTSHPRDMDDDLIAAHGDLAALMPYLASAGAVRLGPHSGGDEPRQPRNDYLDVIARLRASRPDLAFTSDFIVGFPGETDADFRDTLALVRRDRLRPAYTFTYCRALVRRRPACESQIPSEGKVRAAAAAADPDHRSRRAFNGLRRPHLEVLLENRAGRHPGQLVGRTHTCSRSRSWGRATMIGSLVEVAITEIVSHTLSAGSSRSKSAGPAGAGA